MFIRLPVPTILLYVLMTTLSLRWNEQIFRGVCEVYENLNKFTNYSRDLNKILTCVIGFQNFDPRYVLKLEGGINCSGLYGLESSVFESCIEKGFRYQVDCFVYALQAGEYMASIRHNVCLTLYSMTANQSYEKSQYPREEFDLGDAVPNNGFNAVACVNGTNVTTLILPGEYSNILVAASSYDESLRRLKRPSEDALLDKLSCPPYTLFEITEPKITVS
ncbi:unnamed protein product [Nesidiocoris tenuis]|uniref:Transferrin-like domain-containing protein n=1 Tax=Nesidiocoris tenuis TaxID=355587 RepID=A0A6H5HQF3_9HEMI|nr:unnamed protein product [Nesidiocoris tenuis]